MATVSRRISVEAHAQKARDAGAKILLSNDGYFHGHSPLQVF